MSRPRVLVLTKTTARGGAERALENALPHLDVDGFDYRLAAGDGDGPLARAWRRAGLPLLRLPRRTPLHPQSLAALRRWLVAGRIDLVHAHLPLPGVAARLAARGRPVRVVYTEHSTPEGYHPASHRLNGATYAWQHAVIAVSEEVRARAVAAFGPAADARITVIPNGLDLRALDRAAARGITSAPPAAAPGTFVVLVPASLTRVKGHDLVLDAVASRACPPDLALWLAGDGREAAGLRARAAALGIADRVHFLGRRRDVFALMARADAVALPSRTEGHPLALLEAMALGRPVVATAVGGIPEIVSDGESGLLVDAGDPTALARGLARLRHDPALRHRLGDAAARSVRARFDVRITVRDTERLYRQVLARPARQRPARQALPLGRIAGAVLPVGGGASLA